MTTYHFSVRLAPSATLLTLLLSAGASAQQCYRVGNQCFSFAPPPSAIPDDKRIETGLELRSDKLRLTGDVRLRMRAAETDRRHPYNNANDQQATRSRAQLAFQANENVRAFLEFNYSETWAGSGSYSDALGGAANNPNFDGVSQAYFEAKDMLGLGETWRIGRSEFILGNGLILGSCDFLQRPGTFTGAWLSRNFEGHDFEVFMLDDYGPLQSTNAGTRYFGASARIAISGAEAKAHTHDETKKRGTGEEAPAFEIESIRPYFLKGTHDGYVESKDTWAGVNTNGFLPWDIAWMAEFGHRFRKGAKDVSAFRLQVAKELTLFDGLIDRVALTYTDSEGALHINPADFNTAGLLHQYGGAWRSDIATSQLAMSFRPGWDLDVDATLVHMDRRGSATQLGDYEADVLVNKALDSGIHASVGFGIDNDARQVAYLQLTLYF